MYKPLSIALPAEVQAGDSWRLCLVVPLAGQTPTLSIDLSQPDFGRTPFPVTSLPIDIVTSVGAADRLSTSAGSTKGKRSRQARPTQSKPQKIIGAVVSNPAEQPTPQVQAPKQERIERFYLLPAGPHGNSEHGKLLRITEQTSFDLDKVGV